MDGTCPDLRSFRKRAIDASADQNIPPETASGSSFVRRGQRPTSLSSVPKDTNEYERR
jgi:hypothetical protein